MAVIAILGGTGHVGKTVVDTIKDHPSHSGLVVTRQAGLPNSGNITYVQNDFSDAEALANIFDQYNVWAVVSCLSVADEPMYTAQEVAINAAEKSASTTRFIASNWANPSDGPEPVDPWALNQHRARAHLATTSLVWTELATGYLMDFWGIPFLRTHMMEMLPVIDIKNKVAAIPGTGNEVIPFAYSFDVARFVVNVLLDLSPTKWEPITTIVADRLTWNEFLALAEDARGSKFAVSYDSIEDLAGGRLTELPNHVEAYAFFPKAALRGLYIGLELAMAAGRFDIALEKTFNLKYPDFKMISVSKMLESTWKSNRSAP
ncbi:unnamed protein product [Clonostachys rosea]|uniref:NAD(P)-binding domain-containing protein n=1 Tax=Bionectria ochroleuca TaxID=29856 RepID=A0ABY6UJN5_BIOOC|nr:unnamed protein product [Clonostachys rosea]